MFVSCRTFVVFWLACHCLAGSPAQASTETIGPNGIDSAALSLPNGNALTGSGIAIGQVEPTRPGLPVFDGVPNSNTTVVPAAVFLQDGLTSAGANIDDHAEQVAGILISNDPTAKGVAPGASLYSSAHATGTSTLGTDDDLTMRTIQHIATQSGVRAVNHSYRKIYGATVPKDGNDLLNRGIDWSASEHNILHVVSGVNQAPESFSPKANFNGMTIGMSNKAGGTGKYRRVDGGNLITPLADDRTMIDLIAPGVDVRSTVLNNMLTPPVPNVVADDDGTSFAAPHVMGTVALLQEYGDAQIAASAANWTGTVASGPTAQRHEVMKAVLMNSADKVNDTSGTGQQLGMTRDVLDILGNGWFTTEAALNEDVPLDDEMGVGHLNARRALQQFVPGEHDFNGNFGSPIVGDVPLIGWDYDTISGATNPINKYALDTSLEAGNFISITLAWDREVDLAVDDGVFAINDTFVDNGLTDLDLYLVPAGTTDVGDDDIAISESTAFPVEHIFTEIPFDGDYEI